MPAINGSSKGETTKGTSGDDTIYGKGGNDTLIGGMGNDNLFGGRGDDVLRGGPGDDYLHGVGGNKGTGEKDVFLGGSGADIFVLGDRKQAFYVGNQAADFADVRDFDFTEDTLRLHGSQNDYTFGSTSSGGAVEIFYQGDLIGRVSGGDLNNMLSATEFLGGGGAPSA